MKTYLKYLFTCSPAKPLSEILISELADLGFESFVDLPDGFEAYLPKGPEIDAQLQAIVHTYAELGEISFVKSEIAGQNWNALWEADYPEVRLNDRCLVRAPFHPEDGGVETEVVINPQMSFGTGHHATTYLMLDFLLGLDLDGMKVLDMGCGTGVLAIAAMMRGAGHALAIDIEDIAVENTMENAGLNGVHITVEKGGASQIGDRKFHLILANINKNVLRADMSTYAKALHKEGMLLLSGFFTTDEEELRAEALNCGLKFVEKRNKDDWAALCFSTIHL